MERSAGALFLQVGVGVFLLGLFFAVAIAIGVFSAILHQAG